MATKQSEHSTKAPSQAPVFDGLWTDSSTSTSEAQGIPLGKVLYDSGDSFKRFMISHVKILTKKMRTSKIISKKFMDLMKDEHYPINLLMGHMNKMKPEKFTDYLELLLSIAKGKKEDTKIMEKMKAEKSQDMAFRDDMKKLIGIMKGSLEAMKTEPDSRLGRVISDIVSFVHEDCNIQSQTALQTNILQVDHPVSSAPLASSAPPPDGQLGDSVGACFTNEGGILYSPLHGVTVIIPRNIIPEAIPGDPPQFYLSMHFYLVHPFTLEDDIKPCSVIVWFHQRPQFHFIKDVTIKIPHGAIVDDPNDDSLCVLTWGQDKQLKLNTKVPADFSDGYHAVFKVNHFCPKVACKKGQPIRRSTRKKTASSSAKRNIKKCDNSRSINQSINQSIERSIEEGIVTLTHCDSTESGSSSRTLHHQEAMETDPQASAVSQDSMGEEKISDMKYSIVCGMPRDRSQGNWNVLFAASYGNPTWTSELKNLVKKEFGTDADFDIISDVRIKENFFELCKEDWSDPNWKVFSRVRPPSISVKLIQQIPKEPMLEKIPSCSLPRVTFKVSSLREGSHSDLECWIKAKGVLAINEEEVSFLVDSTSPSLAQKGERVLKTARYLYGDDSDIIGAFISFTAKDITLNTRFSDHRKFLGDISLQMSDTDTKKLYEILDRPGKNDSDAFSILGNWVDHSRNVTVTRLKEKLRALNIIDITICDNQSKRQLLSSFLEEISIMDYWDECSELRLNLLQKLQCCWINVGRLLGISENDLESIRTNNLEMIYEWQRREGKGATFGALFKAIQRVFELDSILINDAHFFCEYYLPKLMPKNIQTSIYT